MKVIFITGKEVLSLLPTHILRDEALRNAGECFSDPGMREYLESKIPKDQTVVSMDEVFRYQREYIVRQQQASLPKGPIRPIVINEPGPRSNN